MNHIISNSLKPNDPPINLAGAPPVDPVVVLAEELDHIQESLEWVLKRRAAAHEDGTATDGLREIANELSLHAAELKDAIIASMPTTKAGARVWAMELCEREEIESGDGWEVVERMALAAVGCAQDAESDPAVIAVSHVYKTEDAFRELGGKDGTPEFEAAERAMHRADEALCNVHPSSIEGAHALMSLLLRNQTEGCFEPGFSDHHAMKAVTNFLGALSGIHADRTQPEPTLRVAAE